MGIGNLAEFQLRKKFQEALFNGRYLITITILAGEGKRLEHFYSCNDFKTDDLIPSLNAIALDMDKAGDDAPAS